MNYTQHLTSRRRLVLGINSVVVIICWCLALIPFLSTLASGGDNAIAFFWLLIIYLFLGPFQLICAVYNVLKGSKKQLIYLGCAILFLSVYMGTVFGYLPEWFPNNEQIQLGLSVLTPLLMATVFCVVLYIDSPLNYQKENGPHELLDDSFGDF